MPLEPIDATIVVTAKEHNPSVLQSHFLLSNVVPSDLELAQDPVSTPAFALVRFKSGVQFQAQPDRVSIADLATPEDAGKSRIPEFASKYVQALPHVPYTAVGVNFTVIIPDEQPRASIVARFLRDGPWNNGDLKATDLAFRLTYLSDPGELQVTIDSGRIGRGDSDSHPVIRVQGNYHTGGLTKGNEIAEAVGYIQLFERRWADFRAKVALIFELDGAGA